jgi:SPP1 family predicted phage head-tail adaptor
MKPLRPGPLRNRLTIQQLPAGLASKAPNAFNETDLLGAWLPLATVWAEIKPLTGRELLWAQSIVADVTHQVTIRYFAGLAQTPKMRFLYRDPKSGTQRIFNIVAILNDEERNRRMTVLCREPVI